MKRADAKKEGTGDTLPRLPLSIKKAFEKFSMGELNELNSAPSARRGKEWFTIGNRLVKVHRKSRKSRCSLSDEHCPIPFDFLADEMSTYRWKLGFGESEISRDAWRLDRSKDSTKSDATWIGYSVFTIRSNRIKACPAMPVTQEKQPHRMKRCPRPHISALVARPVTRNEI